MPLPSRVRPNPNRSKDFGKVVAEVDTRAHGLSHWRVSGHLGGKGCERGTGQTVHRLPVERRGAEI